MDKAKGKKMKIQSTNHVYCYNFSMFLAVISPWQLEKTSELDLINRTNTQ